MRQRLLATANQSIRIEALFPNYYENAWVGHSCKSILDGMQLAGARTELSVFSCGKGAKEPNVHSVMPRQLLRFVGSTSKPLNSFLLHRYFETRIEPGTIAYFWLNSPPALVSRVKSRGGFTLREMINCTAEVRREELERAYHLLGWPNPTPVSNEEVRLERDELLACERSLLPQSAGSRVGEGLWRARRSLHRLQLRLE
ncbi:MAG: hypothetical protein QM784_32070 [Polyangiaceae bacterium]